MQYIPLFEGPIYERQKEVEAENNKLIDEFEALPFWKKWTRHEALNWKIRENWRRFDLWQKIKMLEMQNEL